MADTKVGGVYIEIQARMGKLESDLRALQEKMQQTDKSGASLAERFRRIEQSASLFGSKASELANKNAVLRQKMEELIAKGIDPSHKGFAKLKQQYDENQKSIDGLNREVDSSSKSFMNFYKVIAGSAIAAGIYQIGKASLSAAADMEQQRVAFTTMLGSAEKAKTLLAEMQAFAASTPFEFNEIVDASKKLISFGISAEDVQEKLRAIGDVASGLGIPLGELTEIYGKARVQQTLYAEDLNQLAGRGIPIFEELGKVMGVNSNEVKKLGSEGKISFSMLEQVFKNMTSEGGKFAGLMDAQSKTLAGQWSNVNDQLGQTAVLFGDALAPIAESVLSAISHRLKNINQLILNINDSIESNKLDAMLEDYKELQKEAEKINASLWERGLQTVGAREEALKGGDKEVAKLREIQKQTEELHGKIVTQQKARSDSYKAAGGVVDESINKQINAEKKVSDIRDKQNEKAISKTKERVKTEEELEQAKFDRMTEYYNLGVSTLTGFSGQINELASMYASNQTTRIEQEAQKRTDALNTEYEEQLALIEASAASDSQKAEQKKALDEQLARDTKAINDKAEKEKRKIARDAAKIQKDLAIFETIIATPQAAFQAYKSAMVLPYPASQIVGAAMAAATTGLGVAKLKLIKDQPLPALAEGGIVPAIPGGRQITVAEGGNSEGVIPFNERGVDILAQAMEKAISKIGGGSGATNVYIDSELIYSNMYEASRRGAVKIDQRAIV